MNQFYLELSTQLYLINSFEITDICLVCPESIKNSYGQCLRHRMYTDILIDIVNAADLHRVFSLNNILMAINTLGAFNGLT